MKQNLFAPGVFVLSAITLTSFSIRENPQERPRGEKVKKHIMLEKIDDKGHKTALDTTIENDNVFIWHGDTIGGKTDFKFMAKNGLKLDSMMKNIHLNFDYDIKDDGNGKIIVIKSGKDDKHIMHEFITDGDSENVFSFHVNSDDLLGDNDFMIWNDKGGNNTFFAPQIPDLPHLQVEPDVRISGKIGHSNIIDLSDPGIISYKKKKSKNGTEKITIVRKQVDNNDAEDIEEIVTVPHFIKKNIIVKEGPEHIKRIHVIKDDDKKKEMETEENSENN